MYLGCNEPRTVGSFCDEHGKIKVKCIIVKPTRELDEKEKAKGRSSDYWDMDSRDQWAEDKRLGNLDWDGN